MHILHVNAAYTPFVGGAEIYARQIAERLVRAGHQATVATTNAAEVEAFWNPRKQRLSAGNTSLKGVQVWRAPIRYLPGAPLSLFVVRRLTVALSHFRLGARFGAALSGLMPWVPTFERMLHALADRFDLVHGINVALERTFIAAYRFAQQHRLPFVATPFVHLGVPGSSYVAQNYTMPQQLRPLRAADAVLVQTERERCALQALGVAPERLHVLGMGVDPQALSGGDKHRFHAHLGLAPEMPVVLFIGMLTKDKGAHHLIAASELLRSSSLLHALVLIGRAADEFEAIWARMPSGIRQHVFRLGPLEETAELKRDALAAADVLALPSRVDSFGIVLLEAWLYAKPVVGARAGGIPDVIAEGKDGLLVEYGDVKGLAEALAYLLRNPPVREALGQAGRAKVLAHHTWEHVFTRLMSIYDEVLRCHGRPSVA